MRRIRRQSLEASAALTLLIIRPLMIEAAVADPSPAPALCIYRDANYGPNATICIAPGFGQRCIDGGQWSDPAADHGLKDACAGAQVSVPGAIPPQCIYHDVKYTAGSVICVAPNYGQSCSEKGSWQPVPTVAVKRGEAFYGACANAQVPTWNPPPSGSSNPPGASSPSSK
jgi:hypothetical protein